MPNHIYQEELIHAILYHIYASFSEILSKTCQLIELIVLEDNEEEE